MTATDDDIEDSTAPLIEHLAELRQRLIYSAIAFIVAMVACFSFGSVILDFLLMPIEASMRALGDPDPKMQYTAPQEYFFTLIRISMVFGLAISFPVIAYQMWRFVAPGLYRNEKNAFLPFIVASPFLFLLGGSFAHYVVTPLAMKFFLGFADATSVVAPLLEEFGAAEIGLDQAPVVVAPVADRGIDIVFQGKVNETFDITLKLIVAFGLCFQLPVLLTLMGKAGLVSAAGLGSVRKYAVVAILILAAVITPPDVITQAILFVVVYGLYEISIFLVKRVERKEEARLRAEGYFEDDEDDDGDTGEDPDDSGIDGTGGTDGDKRDER
ncbi:twin-arginine translocase subunit TatC [Chachezhania antarctica]|uniref:twin-arginine translocase subunit TatC n=1 Tax=Chachezhania antarctica TaxID=2340860 RepID=UPI000EAFF953|nr:twin-arginine translocase subunit TatC [Chachezhania antarctica]